MPKVDFGDEAMLRDRTEARRRENRPWPAQAVWGGAEGQEAWPEPTLVPDKMAAVPDRPVKREARIIVPVAGLSMGGEDVHLENKLYGFFGGFTMFPARGGWLAPNGHKYVDQVFIYDIACDDNEASVRDLRMIARWVAREYDQQCVYLRLPNGSVEFVGG